MVGRHEELARAAAALDDPAAAGVVIHGAAGVGKSRLAAELLARAGGAGRVVVRARATSASASMPLGPLVHLLPAGVLDIGDPVARYRQIVAGLPVGTGRTVLFVDDLHLLDVASAGIVAQLVDGGGVQLVATVRSGSEAPPTVGSMKPSREMRPLSIARFGT